MPGHARHEPVRGPGGVEHTKPDLHRACHHAMEDWFGAPFALSDYWKSSQNIPVGYDDNSMKNDGFINMCNSLRDVTGLPYHNTYGSTLYSHFMEKPDMYISRHNTTGGSYYLAFGCTNCGSRTLPYKPQEEHPHNMDMKRAKTDPAIRAVFRYFVAAVMQDCSQEEEHYGRHGWGNGGGWGMQ